MYLGATTARVHERHSQRSRVVGLALGGCPPELRVKRSDVRDAHWRYWLLAPDEHSNSILHAEQILDHGTSSRGSNHLAPKSGYCHCTRAPCGVMAVTRPCLLWLTTSAPICSTGTLGAGQHN